MLYYKFEKMLPEMGSICLLLDYLAQPDWYAVLVPCSILTG